MLFNKKRITLILSLFFVVSSVGAQQISVNNSVPIESLIENDLIQGCIEVSNITSTVNGNIVGLGSYGYFERSGSNFPFENGIILTTGNANSSGNGINTNILNDGNTSWGTDPDLELVLGLPTNSTLNATSIEFSFVSSTNQISFNYILASEEYFANNPCLYSDAFAFLIREAGTGLPYQNIALIPGTGETVNTQNIRPEVTGIGGCAAQNETFFEGYNIGDTNYNGRTTILNASTPIQPNVTYDIKIIIADQSDQSFDSAVFIQPNPINVDVDLGGDISICATETTLNANVNNPASYSWFFNDTLIAGETMSTLLASQSGNYAVEVQLSLGNNVCVLQDNINVTLSSEQSTDPISDFLLCDDDGDGEEAFDLTLKNNDVLASIPNSSYTISYHFTSNDAQNNINPITTPLLNTIGNTQTIFVRVEDTNSGCLAFPNFNLVLNPIPTITNPTPLITCDDTEADGITSIDLSIKDTEITNNNTNLTVTYHSNSTDASTASNPLNLPYNATNNEIIYVGVQDLNSGCIATTTLNINILENPIINTDDYYIDACDRDYDEYANFDLTTIIPDVIGALTNVTITFHETLNDANTGNNPIADDTNYANIDAAQQVVYIRVEDDGTGCASVTPIEIHTNLLLTGVEVEDQAFCDINNDGIQSINLETIAIQFINEIPDITITFYETEGDRDNQTNPLDPSVAYQLMSSNQTFYIGITSPTCDETDEFTIELITSQTFTSIQDQDVCDEDQNGITQINLSQYDNLVTQGQAGYTVAYFLTENDASNNNNALPTLYTNTSSPYGYTVYPRIRFSQTGCVSEINPFNITITPSPETNTPDSIYICDTNGNGFSNINLNNVIPQVTSNTNNLNISFHNTQSNANTDTNAIGGDLTNYNAQTETIYIRVEDTNTNCYSTERLNIRVNTRHNFTTISNYDICENNSDGFADFIFINKDSEILNGATGKRVVYFASPSDANNRVNIINKTAPYTNTSNPQTIYVRVENTTDIDCYSTSSFTIEVGSNPLFNTPTDLTACDNGSNSGIAMFNFSAKITEISSGSTEALDITFYESEQDAIDSNNALPLNYINQVNPQEIFAQINNGTACNSITSFELTVIPIPSVSNIPPTEVCDSDNNGVSTFDLTIAENYINDIRLDNLVTSYFQNPQDAQTNTNPIQTPDAYNNVTSPETVYMKVTNTRSNCNIISPIDLILNLPPAYNDFGIYEICENQDSAFVLTEIEPILVDDLTNVTITYHSNFADADTNTNPINATNYNYQSNNDTIFVRLEDTTTTCYTVYDFILQVNPLPIANQPIDMEACDDIFGDDIEAFNLELQTISILDPQDPTNFTVTYYLSDINAMTGNDALDPNHTGTNGQIIYARVENNITGCFRTTSFALIVNPYPNTPQPLIECAENYEGLTTFNLTEAEDDFFIVNNPNNVITYYETLQDLENETNAITNPANYANTSNPQTIYINVFNSIGNCSYDVTLDLNANLPPAINEFDNDTFAICENDTNTFDLTEINNTITNTNINVAYRYFLDPNDAQANINAISNPENYNYTSSLDQLYLRVQLTTTQCFYIYPFQLRVNPLPIANQPPPMEACDTDFDNLFNFDFTQQTATILGSQSATEYTVNYYNSEANANSATQPLDSDYLAANNDTIYARVQNNETGCYNLTNFQTLVYRKPDVNIPPQVLCLNDLPLIVSAETDVPTDTYQWRDENNNLISTTSETQITQIGNYTVTVTNENNCPPTISTFEVTESQSAINVSTEVLHFSDPNTITVNNDGIGDYLYQLDDGDSQTSNTFNNVGMGDHIITIIDLNGCADTTLDVLVIDIPKFFTPNGDRYNATWHIVDINDSRLEGTNIYIFDRYGKLLKQIGYGTPGWNGIYRGFKMPANDYWYAANVVFEGRPFEIKGHFALRR